MCKPSFDCKPGRHYFRCRTCKKSFSVNLDSGRDGPGHDPAVMAIVNAARGMDRLGGHLVAERLICPACGAPSKFNWMGRVVRGMFHKADAPACDGRCTNAPGPSCECRCGGENHGTGKTVAIFGIVASQTYSAFGAERN